jgi:RimJ/RimL family protein N-acetyltransferase
VKTPHPAVAEQIEFETERLLARHWRDGDEAPFASMNADPRVMQYFPARLDRPASDALLMELRMHLEDNGFGIWAIEEKSSRAFIGAVGLQIPAPDLPVFPCVEIAWRLASPHWGRGFATEAARGALRAGFEQLGLPEIVAFTSVANVRSRRLMERLGMRDTGETFDHPRLPEDHPLRRHCLYFLSREEWQAANPA